MPEVSAKIKIGAIEVPEALLRRSPQQRNQQQTSQVATPIDNPLFKIVFSTEVEPEQKRQQIAAFLAFTGTKAETREHNKQREQFEEYLEAERKRMQEELMRLVNTDTFAILQGVINDMNTDLITFEDELKPLTDILDAIYKLQVDGKAIDAFREIQNDRRDEAVRAEEKAQSEREFQELSTNIANVTRRIAELGEDKSFFGWGNVKETARKQIAVKQVELGELKDDLLALEAKLQNAAETVSPTQLADYAEEKAQLRKLLDISGSEHSKKVHKLVDSALRFVKTSSDRLGEVRTAFDQMGDQMEHLKDVNGKMQGVRAIMGEAMGDSKSSTMKLHGELSTAPADESLITKIAREEKLEAVDEHVKTLDNALRTNTVSLTELTGEAITIRGQRDQHQQMMDKTRILHTQGIAGVASRLNTTINALSMAALNESSKIAGQTLRRMVESTNETTQKEVIRSAMGVQDMTADVQTVLGDLATLGETLRASSTIYRSGLSDLHEMLVQAKELTSTVQGDIKDAASIHADGDPGAAVRPNGVDTTAPATSPFGA